jgi:hypothetical protein
VRPQDRDELAKHRKLEAINEALSAELSRHRRMARVALLLVVVLNVVLLAVLAWHLLGHDLLGHD